MPSPGGGDNTVSSMTAPSVRPEERPTPGGVRFSVIIPARNEEKVIGQCLECLARMDYPREAFEVILVDNGSTDCTMEIARSWGLTLNVTVLQKPKVYISALRNFGVASARGELLAFLDADCLVPPGWLRQAEALLSADGAGVVGAHYRIPSNSTWLARAWFDDETENQRSETPYVPSGDLLMSRANFLHIGGFDESIETNEDYELCQRAKAAGLPVRAFPQLEVIHLGTPQTLRAFYGKQRWHGKHVFRVFLNDIWAFPNAKAVFFALYTLLCLAGVAGGALRAVVFGRWGILAGFLAALLTAPLLLAARTAMARKRWGIFLPVAAGFLIFGVARAVCVLDMKSWKTGENARGAKPASSSRDAAGSGTEARQA